MKLYEIPEQNVRICADKIELGEKVSFGKNILVDVRGTFRLGDRSRLGSNAQIEGQNVFLGNDLWSSSRPYSGLMLGRGRKNWPEANFTLGDRCTIHDNQIDLTREVTIGNDVGLSPEVTIYTHGYWLSVLDGYPAKYAPVTIEDGVIVGYRTLILMGVIIGKNSVIGGQSVVTRNLPGQAIYGGNPAKKIGDIIEPSHEEKEKLLQDIIAEYRLITAYRGIHLGGIGFRYPYITTSHFYINAETREWVGAENEETDDLRDFLFRHGIRIYTKRPFKNIFKEDT